MRQALSGPIALMVLCAGLSLLVGCAGRGLPATELDAGIELTYSMEEGGVLTYEMSNSFTQAMEVRGRTFETVSTSSLVFSVEPRAHTPVGQTIGVTVRSMDVSMVTPQGEFSPDTGAVAGRSFDMTVSARGEESDLEGAESVRYDMGPAGERGLGTEFSNIFPDLPERPIAVGESWTSITTVTEGTGRADVRIVTESVNTLLGFETVGGRVCAKIAIEFTGTLEGRGEEQGVDWTTTGDLSGTGTMYFAYKDGLLVSESTSGVGEGLLIGSGDETVEIPMTRTFSFETKLIE